MTKLLIPLVALLLLPAHAAWLEGIRWFRHDAFVRVVFDLSAPAEYRVSERLSEGYVDVILQGDLTRRMAEEIAIDEGGVLSARQLRKTSTSLTWRIQVQNMARVKHMSVDEQPYKVALDFYPAGAAAKPKAAVGKPAAPPAAKAEHVSAPPAVGKAAAKSAAKPAVKPAAKPAAPPAAAHGKTAAPPKPAEVKPGALAGGTGESRLEGLKADERRRVLVGELLLQLGDSAGAMAYLEQVASQAPSHAWTRFLLAQAYLSKGDQYRAERLLEPLAGQPEWKSLLESVQARLHPPDAKGVVPGGDISEEDLAYFIGVLRHGAGLSTKDLYAKAEAAPGTGGRSAFSLAVAGSLGLCAGLLAFLVLEWRRRRRQQELDRVRILSEDSPRRAGGGFAIQEERDYSEVARRVREELDQVLHKDHGESPEEEPFAFPASGESGGRTSGRVSLEEQVYDLADQKKSIVEIAEELNLGVDEVRLHLELREQAGRISNA
ncbi:MAG: tetratricopeptide repeat protein [Candidatus Delongbacteria bacterium]